MTGLAGCEPCTRCGACGWQIHEFDEVTSTNDLVKQAIERGAPEGTAICARVQTQGYGRQGRSWTSPEGGLYLSLLLRPQVPAAQLATLSLVVGLAVRRAIVRLAADAEAAAEVKVKWPNDVVYSAALRKPSLTLSDQHDLARPFQKLCGISLEQYAGALCIGIGVNVQRPRRPALVDGKNAPAYVADLAVEACAAGCGIADVRDAVLQELADAYPLWRRAGFAAFADEYNAAAVLNGRMVTIERMDGSTIASGRVVRVGEDGELIVASEREDGRMEEKAVMSGEAHVSA